MIRWFRPKQEDSEAQQAIRSEPLKVLVGSVAGTSEDAESMARSQIERYFDAPDRSWLYFQELKGYGYHFEVHQGGDGHPYLPSIMNTDLAADESVFLKPHGQRAVEVIKRADGSYQSLVLSVALSQDQKHDPSIVPHRKHMKPYVTTGEEWVRAGIATISLGLLVLSVAGVMHKSFSLGAQGYYEMVESMPISRLFDLGGSSVNSIDPPSKHSLPINQWRRVSGTLLKPGQIVDRLSFDGQQWSISLKNHVNDNQVEEKVIPPVDQVSAATEEPDTGIEGEEHPDQASSATRQPETVADASKSRNPAVQHELSHVGGAN